LKKIYVQKREAENGYYVYAVNAFLYVFWIDSILNTV